ncbi:hypothetical protein EVAR_7982_1 [Eumeta japonica]|uniref:Uncharacterized protein n=1 Tax=Eumeta variegata TaxID=151549 RepID=A0A4C1TGW4_EUMVA|nr:hypothetical protein EVAR_7982_1 [Eumeta japonica]
MRAIVQLPRARKQDCCFALRRRRHSIEDDSRAGQPVIISSKEIARKMEKIDRKTVCDIEVEIANADLASGTSARAACYSQYLELCGENPEAVLKNIVNHYATPDRGQRYELLRKMTFHLRTRRIERGAAAGIDKHSKTETGSVKLRFVVSARRAG